MRIRLQPGLTLAFVAGLLAACGNSKPNPTDPAYIGREGPNSGGQMPGGSILGDSSLAFGTAKTGPGTAVAPTRVAALSASTPICGAVRWIR